MKIGTVDSSGDALVPLTVKGLGSGGQHRDVTALLDLTTGRLLSFAGEAPFFPQT